MAASQQEKVGQSETTESKFAIRPPAISLPKGGGAIKGIGETFQPNPFTGTASLSIPIFTSPGRSGFGPELSLSYGSGSGNGIFGLGWSLSIPSITRKTEKGLPQYLDHDESDTFILSGAEDLVPALKKQGDNWEPDELDDISGTYRIKRYRPRTEGLFARIERWTKKADGDVHWRSITKENITSVYGYTKGARIADNTGTRIFSWLLEQTFDEKGNLIAYEYKKEDRKYRNNNEEIEHDFSLFLYEKNREGATNTYIKTIYYGNAKPTSPGYYRSLDYDKDNDGFYFKVVFDYGEHKKDYQDKDEIPELVPNPKKTWLLREDPFSSYRSGFEIRTRRLCHHVLMFHHFPDEGLDNALVRSTDFAYEQTPELTRLLSVTQTGYANGKKKSLPPLEFDYSRAPIDFEKCCIDEPVRDVDPDSLENVPQGLSGPYQLIDLNGDGIAGILTEQAGAWHYKAPLGRIEKGDKKDLLSFAPMVTLSSLPSRSSLQTQQFMDLDGNGYKEVVQFNQPVPGYVEREDDETWSAFHSFNSLPNIDWQDPNLQFIDLNGDGHADILIIKDDYFVWYPSLKKKGFGEARYFQKPKDDEKGPALVFSDGTQSLHLADISGDGLSDLVRIRNRSVEYWPNNGYGRFGAKISIGEPYFTNDKEFRQDRIRLFDTDGSGTTDIIYFGSDGTKLYLNQAGNSFRGAIKIKRMPVVDNETSVQVTDLHGNGTGCLTWSSPDSDQITYIDLMGGIKPHLLTKAENNLGAETHITYASSTTFYLKDKENGKLWITKLPFPVQVIKRIDIIDRVSKTKYSSTYSYSHGFFDGYERAFLGFGRVQQIDTDEFKQEANEKQVNQAPVKTITWFHTGSWKKDQKISTHFEIEYYKEDENHWLLKDTILPPDLSPDEKREACRALRGRMLRQEVYAMKGSEKEKDPYTVTESNFFITPVQPKSINKHAVFSVVQNESLSYHYERSPLDPRILHKFTLEIDEFGNITRSATVAYPRRNVPDRLNDLEQTQALCKYNINTFSDSFKNNEPNFIHYHSIPLEQKSYEICGINTPDNEPLTVENIRNFFNNATPIGYEKEVMHENLEKRLIVHSRQHYCDHLNNELPFGNVAVPILSCQKYDMALTRSILDKAYEGLNLDYNLLNSPGKYFQYNDLPDTWWVPSGKQEFDQNNFYLPTVFIDPFSDDPNDPARNYETKHDKHHLLLVSITDPIGNKTSVKNNYRILKPFQLTDINQNTTEVAFDALGMMVGIAIIGNPNIGDKGDSLENFDENISNDILNHFFTNTENPLNYPLNDPNNILQKATKRIIYDLDKYRDSKHYPDPEPIIVASIAREIHEKVTSGSHSSVQISFLHQDGLGRNIQTKIQAEPDPQTPNIPRWVGTGRTVYNNKGNPVKQYEPFFSDTHLYEPDMENGITPIICYDPVGRVTKIEFPDGTLARVEFTSWAEKQFDQNDTVLDEENGVKICKWFTDRDGSGDTRKQRAADSTKNHANTPTTMHLDVLARPYISIADNNEQGKYQTRSKYDIQKNILYINDPLMEKDPQGVRSSAIITTFDMLGNDLRNQSFDKGDRRILNNVAGNPLFSWDSKGNQVKMEYDQLQRSTHKYLKSDNNKLVEYTVYGEAFADAQNKLKGQVYKLYDGAGCVTNEIFDFKGNLLVSYRQLANEDKEVPEWSNLGNIADEKFKIKTEYDALNRPITITNFKDGNLLHKTKNTFNEAGLLDKVEVSERGTYDFNTYVKNINYNENGQRTLFQYGNFPGTYNGIRTTYSYDDKNFRLINLKTTKPPHHGIKDHDLLQDIYYFYDPAGNILEIEDKAQQTVYYDGQENKPISRYEYDAIYRLICVEGREHKGQNCQGRAEYEDLVPINVTHPNDHQALRYYKQEYVYDENGNINLMTHVVSQTVDRWTRDYTYDPQSNRLIKTSINGSDFEYEHDNNGNITKMPHLPIMEWNHHDRLIKVIKTQVADPGSTPDPNGTVYCQYDPGGQRVRKLVKKNGNTVCERIYLGHFELFRERKVDTDDILNEQETLHIMDDKNRIALMETETIRNSTPINNINPVIRYELNNRLNSSHIELSEHAEVISYEEYHPYGTSSFLAKNTGISRKRYRYTGKERDEETGLYYYSARYYAPWLGRWTSTDPGGRVEGINFYSCMRSNPMRFRDRFGEQSDEPYVHEKNKTPLVGDDTLIINTPSDIPSEVLGLSKEEYYKYIEREIRKQESRITHLRADLENIFMESSRLGSKMQKSLERIEEGAWDAEIAAITSVPLIGAGFLADMAILSASFVADQFTGPEGIGVSDVAVAGEIVLADVLENENDFLGKFSSPTGKSIGSKLGKILPVVSLAIALTSFYGEVETFENQTKYSEILSKRFEEKIAEINQAQEALNELKDINLGNPKYRYHAKEFVIK